MREDHATGVGHIDHYYCQASLPTWSSGVAPCNHGCVLERDVPGGGYHRGYLRAVPPLTSRALRPVPQPELATPRTGRAVRYRRNRWRYVGGSRNHVPPRPVRNRMRLCCVCALSRPRWERLSQSAIWNGRIALSALRPAGDRCREMQACSTLVHHITSMRGVAPYKCQ